MAAVLSSLQVQKDVIDLTTIDVQDSSRPGSPNTPPSSPISNSKSQHSKPIPPVSFRSPSLHPSQPQVVSSEGAIMAGQSLPLLPPSQVPPAAIPDPASIPPLAVTINSSQIQAILSSIPYADLRSTPNPLPPIERIGKYIVEYNKYYRVNNGMGATYLQILRRQKNLFIYNHVFGNDTIHVKKIDLASGGLSSHPHVQQGFVMPRILPSFLKTKIKQVHASSNPSQSGADGQDQTIPGKLPTKTKVNKVSKRKVITSQVPSKKSRKTLASQQPVPSASVPVSAPSLPVASTETHRVISDEKGILKKSVNVQKFAWYFFDNSNPSNQWIPFDATISDEIEQSYLDCFDSVGYYIGGHDYKLVFSNKTQTNLSTHTQRLVQRCPKDFTPNDTSLPKPPSVADSSRISTLISMLGSSRPTYWTPEDIQKAMQSPQVVPCQPGDAEFDMVAKMIQVTCRDRAVVSVSKIINPVQYFRYTHWCDMLKLKFPTMDLNERYAFHGTNEKAIEAIVKEGFKYRFNSRHLFGRGSYFSTTASYSLDPQYASPNANGEQHVIVTRICVGKTVQGTQNLLPSMDDSYQTAVDDMHSPNTFVTFHDDQTFPEFLVALKRFW
jgi:hypothetical protein